MFETSRRPHPLSTFRFWFVILAAGSVTLAWKFDMLPFHIGPAATGELSTQTFTDIESPATATTSSSAGEIDLPFTTGQETLNVPEIASSSFQQTAQMEPSQHGSPQTPATPTETDQASRFDMFDKDEWQTTAAATPAGTAASSPIQQTNATSASFETESTSNVEQPDAPFATADVASSPDALSSGIDFTQIDSLMATGLVADEVEAHRLLSTIYWQQPAAHPALRQRIDTLSQKIYFLGSRHYMDAYQVQAGDMLQNIARQYDVSWQYLAKLNRVDPKRVKAGQRLKVIKGPFSAVIDLSDYELTIHAHGYYVTRFPVGIGKDGSSPIGKFTVQEKLVDPTYYGPDSVIAHDDPANPLGERWIDIGNSYGIHGTIDPTSIGKSESRGCIRLHNDDAAAVYDLLTLGSEVTIRP